MSIAERVIEVINDILEEDIVVIDENTVAESVESWDSVAQVKIVLMLESEFGIRFSTESVSKIKSVKGFVDAIQALT